VAWHACGESGAPQIWAPAIRRALIRELGHWRNLDPIPTSQRARRRGLNHQEAIMDMKLEALVVPVSDVDRAKRFYEQLGWRLDIDFASGPNFRAIQFTPPGSAASIQFGKGLTTSAPGTLKGVFLVVSDIESARADLVRRGVAVSEVFHQTLGGQPLPGPDPQHTSYASFATFGDPDGNGYLLQEIRQRLPGR
jgi:catechol 2,3-dioxygenase-like lactoylglutathione lyase family enzyme